MTNFNTTKKHFTDINGRTHKPYTEIVVDRLNAEPVNNIADIEGHEACHAWVLYTGHYIVLQSYSTIVSIYDRTRRTVTEEKYSPTTSRQQTWFRRMLREEGYID